LVLEQRTIDLPTFRGFKSFFGFAFSGEQDHFEHEKKGIYDMQFDKEERCGDRCSQFIDERGNYSSDVFARESIRVIEEHAAGAAKSSPLFLVLSYAAVHKPVQVPPSYRDMYAEKMDWSPNRKLYAAMCTAADDSLAGVLDAFNRTGMWDDTLVVYMSDNGAPPMGGQFTGGSNYPLKKGKGYVWEGGVVADGIISGPAREKLGIIGGKLSSLFHAVDWLPTLAEITDASPNGNKTLHGVRQLSTLQGGAAARTELHLGYSTRSPKLAAFRQDRWKIMVDRNSKQKYLFDILEDPSEDKDLARTYRNITAHLSNLMYSFQASHFDGQVQEPARQCGRAKYAKTHWNQEARIPWCI